MCGGRPGAWEVRESVAGVRECAKGAGDVGEECGRWRAGRCGGMGRGIRNVEWLDWAGFFCILEFQSLRMNTLTIENKKYVVIPEKEYEQLKEKAVSKTISAKKLSLTAGKKLAYKMIDKWAKGK
jgi:hypothetical protein